MAEWHGYVGVESLALTNPQRNTLLAAIQSLGLRDGGAAHERMQPFPVRLDNQAGIFEAMFDTDTLTVAIWKNRLASIFNVNAATITSTVNTPTFGLQTSTLVTFSRSGIDYIRVCLFGGVTASWFQSRDECAAYLAANNQSWYGIAP